MNQLVKRFEGAVKMDDDITKKTDFSDTRYLVGHPEAVTSKEICQLLKMLEHKVCIPVFFCQIMLCVFHDRIIAMYNFNIK